MLFSGLTMYKLCYLRLFKGFLLLFSQADTSMEKLKDIDKLTDKIDQYRSENEHLRSRIGELEKVRDNLISQKEELLVRLVPEENQYFSLYYFI